MDRRLLLDIPDLPPEGFKHVGDKRIKPEGGGGKGGGGSTTTVQQSIPKELVPFIKDVIKEGQKVAALPYVPYTGQRVAGFTPGQTAVQREVAGLRTPQEIQTAMRGAQGTGSLAFRTAQQGLDQALGFAPGQFGAAEATQYMSPFQQGVTDIALREAQRAADMERRNIGLRSGLGGAGGSASALEKAELNRNVMTNLGDIQARGSQAAFENAQQQFERDRAARLAKAGLGAQVGTAGLGTSLSASMGLGELAGAKQRADLARLEAQRASGQQVQDQNQKILTQRYQDFLAQKGYPREQIAFYSDLVRGNAPLFGTIQQTTTPAPNLASQLGGLGLAGLSLYNLTK